MFPGAVNSPETFITNAIDTTNTEITVQSLTGWPDAPFLMVLGSTLSNAETVLVLERTSNTLTVQRGYQGVAQSWPQGTAAAVNFTEAHYRALVDNINVLSADKANLTDLDKAMPIAPAGAVHGAAGGEWHALKDTFAPLVPAPNTSLGNFRNPYTNLSSANTQLVTPWPDTDDILMRTEHIVGAVRFLPNVPNQKFDVVLNSVRTSFDGIIEVEAFAGWRFDPANIGRVVRKWVGYVQPASERIFLPENTFTIADPHISSYITISELRIINNQITFTVARRPENSQRTETITIIIRVWASVRSRITNISLSPIYTNDPTIFPPATLFPPPVWHNLVLLNGFGASPAQPPQYCIIGNIVHIRGRISGIASSNLHVFTLPVGFRSTQLFFQIAPSTLSFVVHEPSCFISFHPNGAVAIRAPFPSNDTFSPAMRDWFINFSFVANH